MNISKPRIGYLGIGLMGEPMTMRLLKAGFSVSVWNRTQAKLENVVQHGAVAFDTPAELAAQCDYLFMCLMDAAAIEHVVFGPQGIAQISGPTMLVDFGTIHPDQCREFAERLHTANGMKWIDAPISGGVPGAEAGTLAIMAGGHKDDIEQIRPVIEVMSDRFSRMGDLGAGLLTKLCNQIIVGCTISVIAESVHFAEKAGVDAAALTTVLKGGFADSLPFQMFAPRMANREFENPMGHTNTMLKDLIAVDDIASKSGAKIQMSSQALELLQKTATSGDGDKDICTIIRQFDEN